MVITEYIERIQDLDAKNTMLRTWKWTKGIAAGLIGATVAFGSFYTVPNNSVGVVQTFGAYSRSTEPGLHLKMPLIEGVTKVPIKQVQKVEFGFRSLKPGIDSQYIGVKELKEGRVPQKDLQTLLLDCDIDLESKKGELVNAAENALRDEYLMLTGDLNMADIEFIVQYDIKDARGYLFNIREQKKTIRDAAISIMRQLVGNGSVDEAITIGRIDYENECKIKLQELLDQYQSGINVQMVKLQSCNPPEKVQAAFNAVNEALQKRETRINEARKAYNEVIPKAKGEALQEIEKANGYATKRVNEAQGDVTRFERVLTEYKKAPEVTRQRMYLETMGKVLPEIKEKWIVENGNNGLLRLLNLNEKPRVEVK